jgi:hypothetical protein
MLKMSESSFHMSFAHISHTGPLDTPRKLLTPSKYSTTSCTSRLESQLP